MKLAEKHIHLLFKVGIIIKGVDGILETMAGLAFSFCSPESLRRIVDRLTQEELQEDPTDFAANHLVHFFDHLSPGTKHFASAYLLVYGITKIGLAIALLRGKLWAYPIGLAILGFFLCYQVYRLSHHYSIGLGLMGILNLGIILLVWRDYKYMKKNQGTDRI